MLVDVGVKKGNLLLLDNKKVVMIMGNVVKLVV